LLLSVFDCSVGYGYGFKSSVVDDSVSSGAAEVADSAVELVVLLLLLEFEVGVGLLDEVVVGAAPVVSFEEKEEEGATPLVVGN
jgi:hypothetical protein